MKANLLRLYTQALITTLEIQIINEAEARKLYLPRLHIKATDRAYCLPSSMTLTGRVLI